MVVDVYKQKIKMELIQKPIIFALIAILIILLYRKIVNKNLFFTSYSSKQKKLNLKSDKINSIIIDALKKSGFNRIKESDNSFKAISYPSIWSFSETIEIDKNKIDDENFLISIKSSCFFPLQIFDWGKNEKNCEKFLANLTL